MLFWIAWIILIPWIYIIFPTRIIGKKHIKQIKKQAAITSCNHQSMIDPVVLKARVNTRYKLMAKDSLFKNKFMKFILTKCGAYPVKRGENDLSAVKTTLTYLKSNKHLVIFPEGTRITSGEIAELKNGLVMFALKTDCYVVPGIFKKRPKLFRFNTLLIGKPFKFSDFEEFKGQKLTKNLMDKASQVLNEKMQYLKEVSIKDYKQSLKNKKSR